MLSCILRVLGGEARVRREETPFAHGQGPPPRRPHPPGVYVKISFNREVTRTEMYSGPFKNDDAATAWTTLFEREAGKDSRFVVATDLTGPPPIYPATTTAADLVTRWGAALAALRSEQKEAATVAENHPE